MAGISTIPIFFAKHYVLLGLGYLIMFIVVGLIICAIVGYWAGKVADSKGKSFAMFFTLGFIATICGLIPGILVVIIAYVMEPEGGAPMQGYQQTPYGQPYQQPQQPPYQQPYQQPLQQPYQQPPQTPQQPYTPPPGPPQQPPGGPPPPPPPPV